VSSPLFAFVEEHELGEVFGADGGFRLSVDPDTIVAPDVAFVSLARIPADRDFQSFFPGAPDHAVEVGSVSNTRRAVEDRVRRYFSAGGRLVWAAWPRSKTVEVHRPGRDPEVLGVGDVLDGEDVVPGFRLPVGSVFKEPRRGGRPRH
jgi:Uma2 family endonuclease